MSSFFSTAIAEEKMPRADGIESFVNDMWSWEKNRESLIVQTLKAFIAIPGTSPNFDPDWAQTGHTDAAVDLLVNAVGGLKEQWSKKGYKTEDITLAVLGGKASPEMDANNRRRTPLIYIEIPAFGPQTAQDTVLFYGHMDKQPDMLPWAEGLAPRVPVLRGDRLYGRGGADDGYALFSALTSVMALRAQNIPHARCVIVIEAAEESDSPDLQYYLQKLRPQLGNVSLVICLDSGSGNYEQLWLTTSLRGMLNCWMDVRVLKEGIHSGSNSGVVPSSFRITRQLLSRLEDEKTGEIVPAALRVSIPEQYKQQADAFARQIGDQLCKGIPFVNDSVQPVTTNRSELLLNRSWKAQLSITGIQGLPGKQEEAGNVLLPYTKTKISLRLPPTLSPDVAEACVRETLTGNVPYNAVVTISGMTTSAGWAAPPLAPWLENANREASMRFFRTSADDVSRTPLYVGEGGTIAVMEMLGTIFPQSQFMVTGVLGPNSNAHGPNEFLDLPFAKKITMCVAHVLAEHGKDMQRH